jgi:hypothetical protein
MTSLNETQVVDQFSNSTTVDFKNALTDCLVARIDPIRQEIQRWRKPDGMVTGARELLLSNVSSAFRKK